MTSLTYAGWRNAESGRGLLLVDAVTDDWASGRTARQFGAPSRRQTVCERDARESPAIRLRTFSRESGGAIPGFGETPGPRPVRPQAPCLDSPSLVGPG